jgi:hypothetical protein
MNISEKNKRLLFGPVAGVVESLFVYPIDTLKVLKQSNQYFGMKSILINDPKSLYKGFTPFTSQMFLKYFLRFTVFEIFKSTNDNVLENFRAGACAGFTESFFITPFELIKTQLQTSKKHNPTTVIKELLQDKGILGLYKGFASTCMRQSINQGINFSLYYKLRKEYINEKEKPSNLKICSIVLFSSSLGPILTSPIDTIKTRFMNPNYKYKSIKEAIVDIKTKDGIKGFYKGLVLRILRVSGGQMITFMVIENLLYYTSYVKVNNI